MAHCTNTFKQDRLFRLDPKTKPNKKEKRNVKREKHELSFQLLML
jgi:hypothetical protein